MHILLADDSKTAALLIIAFLEQQGCKVTYVVDGQAAVTAYQTLKPDLVLMDVVMPIMDGIEATRRIKTLSSTSWVPVMLMTGLSGTEAIIAGLNAGADDYLIKPIVFEVLGARVRSMQRIATMQDSLRGILDNVYEAILTINEAGIIQSYNLAAERIFGYTSAEAIGTNVKMLMPSPYAEQHDGYLARYLRERIPHVIGTGRKVSGRRKNGEIFPIRLCVTEIKRSFGSCFIGLVSDISSEEENRQRIEFLALHDGLTALPNRAHFNDTLDTLLATGSRGHHALFFMDLNGFKPINDTLGHEAGDEALKVVANRLRHNLAEGDFVARLGGDEFVAIIKHVFSPEAALAIAQRLLSAISMPVTLLGTPCAMGASIGIAMIPEHGTTANEILTAADNAMYAAKRGGKNRCTFAGGCST